MRVIHQPLFRSMELRGFFLDAMRPWSRRRGRFVLRAMDERSAEEVRTILQEAALRVDARLKKHAMGNSRTLPVDWKSHLERVRLMGDGRIAPDLVSYMYKGRSVLSVWTRVEKGDLLIDLHETMPPRTRANIRRSRPMRGHRFP